MGAALVLASASPRRAKILAGAGVVCTVRATSAREVAHPADPAGTVRENALLKLAAARADRPTDAACGILAADTIVWFANRIYGKPRDLAEAAEFLRTLAGHTHVVFTGVAYLAPGAAEPRVAVETSGVTFKPLSDAEIAAYVARVNPLDRAGAYDIDVSGDLLVARLDGEYENVMGLPLAPLRRWGLVPARRFP